MILDKDFAELEGLISSAMEEKNLKARLDTLQKTLRGQMSSKTERERLQAEFDELEARLIWEPVAQVALFQVRKCVCGAHDPSFSSFMLEMRHRQRKNTRRWTVNIGCRGRDLPKKTMYHYIDVPMCFQCMDPQEWNLLKVEEISSVAVPVFVPDEQGE